MQCGRGVGDFATEGDKLCLFMLLLTVVSFISGVLDEEEDDVLVNVNIIDDERAQKNVENKKKNPEYKPYDEPEFDEYGMVSTVEMMPFWQSCLPFHFFLIDCKTVQGGVV